MSKKKNNKSRYKEYLFDGFGAKRKLTHSDLIRHTASWLRHNKSQCPICEIDVGWEIIDVLSIANFGDSRYDARRSGITFINYEIKISRSDYFADKKKTFNYGLPFTKNKIYVTPMFMIQPEEIYEGCGLIWWNYKNGYFYEKVAKTSFERCQPHQVFALWKMFDRNWGHINSNSINYHPNWFDDDELMFPEDYLHNGIFTDFIEAEGN